MKFINTLGILLDLSDHRSRPVVPRRSGPPEVHRKRLASSDNAAMWGTIAEPIAELTAYRSWR
jgi:hypothetical protein